LGAGAGVDGGAGAGAVVVVVVVGAARAGTEAVPDNGMPAANESPPLTK
jgi:hypothetical protein